jgi:hypothetical protein
VYESSEAILKQADARRANGYPSSFDRIFLSNIPYVLKKKRKREKKEKKKEDKRRAN